MREKSGYKHQKKGKKNYQFSDSTQKQKVRKIRDFLHTSESHSEIKKRIIKKQKKTNTGRELVESFEKSRK